MTQTYTKRQIIILVSFLICIFFGILFLMNGFQNTKIITLRYKEDNDIDYKVYLKDNAFFEEKYIEKGKTYITSLIDYIDADYSYNLLFDKPVEGTVKYQVVAVLEANKANNDNGNYWTKEYEVTKVKEEKIQGSQNVSIHQNVKIDYNQYNEILNSFKKTMGLANSDGILKVYLKVNSNIISEEINTKVDSDLILKLPLSQMAIEASIDSDINNQGKAVSKTIKDHNIKYLLWKIGGVLFLVLGGSLVWLGLRNQRVYKINNQYELELKKILSTYDSIIVNVEEPNLEDFNIIKVESFEELIDAHSEIRMPINYYQKENASIFVLFNDNTAWKYVLEKKQHRRSARK